MNEPLPKKNISIEDVNEDEWRFSFYSTDYAYGVLNKFGTMRATGSDGILTLDVNKCYDFNEVLEYAKSLNENKTEN